MSVLGDPSDWVDLLDSLMPQILALILAGWESLPAIELDWREDDITLALCRALRAGRGLRDLPFQVHPQQAEIEPAEGENSGRLDIAFNLLVPSEQIYFCLEGKRLNVPSGDGIRAYAAEYVQQGMMRFVTGQYARAVRHGGMIGYVLDGKVARAIANIEANVRTHHVALRMSPPGELVASAFLSRDRRARESHHTREVGLRSFRIHHLFVAPN